MRCKWCGKETGDKEYCNFECRKAFFDHFDEVDRFKDRRTPMLIACVLISIPLIILFCGAGVTVMFFLVGMVIYTHPFPSAKLRKKLTAEAAVGRVKTNGILLMLIGLPFLFLTYTPFF